MPKKKVYIAMVADVIHPGHLNIIKIASELGDVTVGILPDKGVAEYKRLPLLAYEQRKTIVENIKGVDRVVCQETIDYRPNLRKIKPDYVVHGNDWKEGFQKKIRQQVIDTLAEWGGEVIEPEYTEGVSSTQLLTANKQRGITPDSRRGQLYRLLNAKDIVRCIEAHNGLTGLIAEETKAKDNEGKSRVFDALWVNSLTESAAKGRPDVELVHGTSLIDTISDIIEVTTKPIIVDGDSGGSIDRFRQLVRAYERLGISAIVIEDKIGQKNNILLSSDIEQKQDITQAFTEKIRSGVVVRSTDEFMIIARITTLTHGGSVEDAIKRAEAYIAAGANAIMIESEANDGKEVKEFARQYSKLKNKQPLVVAPTSYSQFKDEELSNWGADIIVYDNNLLRAAHLAMQKVANSILQNGRSKEADKYCDPISEILKKIPGNPSD